jgi:voltage-gated potassium channel
VKFLGQRDVSRHQVSDLWRRLRIAAAVLVGILAVGTWGYVFLGLDVVDALYQTVITVSTVGFREVGDVQDVDTGYKMFTIGLIMVGAGAVLYTLGVLIETLLEGRLTHEFWRRRMERNIDQLSGHVIVCGWGQVGQAIVSTLTGEGKAVVVIDREDPPEMPEDQLRIVGDATEDSVLSEAGIDRADALVVGLDTDEANVYVTLSGRAANPKIFIVARANAPEAEAKIYRAGANRVVNPHRLGGAHMAALVSQPHVTEFFDITMADRELAVSISEIVVPAGSPLTQKPLAECDLAGTTVLAIRRSNGQFEHRPPESTVASPHDVLIVLGTDDELSEIRSRVS